MAFNSVLIVVVLVLLPANIFSEKHIKYAEGNINSFANVHFKFCLNQNVDGLYCCNICALELQCYI